MRISDLSSDVCSSDLYASKDWRWRISRITNDHGQLLRDQLRISRRSQLRNGSSEYAQVNVNSSGVDDLLTRGHGVVKLPANFNAAFEYDRPRKGNWAYDFEVDEVSGGLAGNDKIGYEIELEPTYLVSDARRLNAGFYADSSPRS